MTTDLKQIIVNMNENIDLVKILKNCPSGTTFWSKLHGQVIFKSVQGGTHPIHIIYRNFEGFAHEAGYTKEGYYSQSFKGECLLVPSKEQQDWSKFKAPWLKKPKFDPKTLQPFDKVLVRYKHSRKWFNDFYSFIGKDSVVTVGNGYFDVVIPYNEETKHLVGTTEEVPEYYRYWED